MKEDQEPQSYDVAIFFTSVPVDKSVECIRSKLEADPTLPARTNMSPQQVCLLLEFCHRCTYFVFDGQFYMQIHGVAIGSSVFIITCDACMEDIRRRP